MSEDAQPETAEGENESHLGSFLFHMCFKAACYYLYYLILILILVLLLTTPHT